MTKFILGIDIGGTNIKGGIFDLKEDKIKEKKFIKTSKKLDEFLISLHNIISFFKEKYEFDRVGIGFPGNIDKNGRIVFSPHIPDSVGFNIVKYFKEMNLKLKIENDANLAALAHLKFLNNNNISDLICLTLGTGIGGGVVLNKKMLNSSKGIGFELGHIQVNLNGAICSCGKKGCVEAYSSSSGMLNRFGDGNLKEFLDLYNLYKNGNQKAAKIIEEGFFYLGIAVGNLVNIFAPEIVYIAGGISEKFYEFYEFFINGVKKSILPHLFHEVDFKKSDLKDAGILGAIALWI